MQCRWVLITKTPICHKRMNTFSTFTENRNPNAAFAFAFNERWALRATTRLRVCVCVCLYSQSMSWKCRGLYGTYCGTNYISIANDCLWNLNWASAFEKSECWCIYACMLVNCWYFPTFIEIITNLPGTSPPHMLWRSMNLSFAEVFVYQ